MLRCVIGLCVINCQLSCFCHLFTIHLLKSSSRRRCRWKRNRAVSMVDMISRSSVSTAHHVFSTPFEFYILKEFRSYSQIMAKLWHLDVMIVYSVVFNSRATVRHANLLKVPTSYVILHFISVAHLPKTCFQWAGGNVQNDLRCVYYTWTEHTCAKNLFLPVQWVDQMKTCL